MLLCDTHAHAASTILVLSLNAEAGMLDSAAPCVDRVQIMEYCKGGDLFKNLMMKGGTLDEAWVCTEVRCLQGSSSSSMC
jgi:hypothetical protein